MHKNMPINIYMHININMNININMQYAHKYAICT